MFFGALTLLFAGALVVWGIPFFVRLADFLGQAKNKSQEQAASREDQIPPLPPRFVFIPEATNSASIPLKGFSERGSQVQLYLNNKMVAETDTDEEGEFSLEKIILSLGENNIKAKAIDKAGNESELSAKSLIVYDNKPPILEMESPEDGSTIYDQTIEIKGKTDPDAKVTVNEHLVIVESDGNFVYQFEMAEGKNDIQILAQDLAGNKTEKKLTVTYHI